MGLNQLTIKDRKLFNRFLNLKKHNLSVYAFENIYIWKKLFSIEWTVIRDSLCIFFKDRMGSFLYLNPLGEETKPEVIEKVFRLLNEFNKNKEVSRIENIEDTDTAFYHHLGFECRMKSSDYLCLRSQLTNLEGTKFKSKRACFNYFIKHYEPEYLPFSESHREGCLKLYHLWMQERKAKHQDALYQGMLADSWTCLKLLLDDYPHLDLIGRVVRVAQEIKGFSFGFQLNKDTFCILYEVTDLSIKGLAQFIFRELCRELTGYKYINIMDDSGLENLKKVKLSYHPFKLIPAYIVKKKR
jgi:hypothetical protein